MRLNCLCMFLNSLRLFAFKLTIGTASKTTDGCKHRQFFGDASSLSQVPVGKVKGNSAAFFPGFGYNLFSRLWAIKQGMLPSLGACARQLVLLNPKIYGCILDENYI